MSEEYGLNFIVGLRGSKLSSEEADLLAKLKPAGVIIFAHNIDQSAGDAWPEKFRKLILEVTAACGQENLLVSIDHEGGRVHRFPSLVTQFPAARYWGEHARHVGVAMGKELRALGLNLNFAPVLDVHCEPENTVIGERAFSCFPKKVYPLAKEYISGLTAEGVLPCGKHFPGHGATVADSHYEMPILDIALESLIHRELIPFQQAIMDEIPLLMTAHVMFPQIDKESCATFSKKILTDLLRAQLGFSGALVSDDLHMNALANISDAEKAVAAVNAGVDILLVGNPLGDWVRKTEGNSPAEVALKMAESLKSAKNTGKLSKDAIKESQQRVSQLLEHAKSIREKTNSSSYTLEVLNAAGHQQLSELLRSQASA